MTFRELLERVEQTNNCADIALADMMDIIEEQTGVWPEWTDEAPEWVLKNFGVQEDELTAEEWNEGIEFLQNAEQGSWIEYKDRKVAVENMCGGRYLCYENGEVEKLVETEAEAMLFLKEA